MYDGEGVGIGVGLFVSDFVAVAEWVGRDGLWEVVLLNVNDPVGEMLSFLLSDAVAEVGVRVELRDKVSDRVRDEVWL